MAAITINLSTNVNRQYYTAHGANITAQAAAYAYLEYRIIDENNTVAVEAVYYVSEAAKNAGGTPTPIYYTEGGNRHLARSRFQQTVANQTTFNNLTISTIRNAVKDLIETEFGAGTATIVV